MKCKGSTCGAEIAFVKVWSEKEHREKPIPVDVPLYQTATLEDGRKARVFVCHHSTCPDVKEFGMPGAKR